MLRVLTFLLALVLVFDRAHAAEPIAKPNVIVIVSDDQGWNDIGYNNSKILTPRLDELARTGVRLDANYVFPTCSPTRVGLLSGRNPSRYGIHGPIAGRSTKALPPETVTLADALKAVGYRTAISGKWHLGLRPEVGPLAYGFDSTYGYLHGQLDQFTHVYKNGDRTWHRQDQYINEEGHATDLITDEAVRVIEDDSSEPFFLYVAYSVPHYPLQETDEWTAKYDGRIDHPDRKLFAASLTHMDAGIGRIVEALERTGQRKSTLLIFSSDNGGQRSWSSTTNYGGKFKPNEVLGDNRPLRGWKGELFEGGIRVPAIVNWPGTLTPHVVSQPISILDWYPTIAARVGIEVPRQRQLEGVDVWPLLVKKPGSEKAEPPADRILYWNTGRAVAVRIGSWKLLRQGRESPSSTLFDLANNPHETTNLASTHADQLATLKKELARQQTLDP